MSQSQSQSQDQSSDEIRENIEQTRDETGRDIQQVKSEVKQMAQGVKTDVSQVRRFIEEQPLAAAAVAIGVGIAISGMVSNDRSGRVPPERQEVNETLVNIKDALMAVGKREIQTFTQGFGTKKG